MMPQQPFPQVLPPIPQQPVKPAIPPLAESRPQEAVFDVLPVYSMMAYMPQQQVLTRALGLYDE